MPEVRHAFVPMPDGVRLHATLYVPEGDGPWPAILEVLPYRKDDLTASYRPDYVRLAELGYVVCRADVRGTGTSEGVSTDEYSHEERSDLVALIGWLATQEPDTPTMRQATTTPPSFQQQKHPSSRRRKESIASRGRQDKHHRVQ